MEEFIVGMAIIMTFGLLMTLYRLNLRLAYYRPEPHKQWPVTDKINNAGKYMAFVGGLATFPFALLMLFKPDTMVADWLLYLTLGGMATLVVAVPVMLIALFWRTSLSSVSVTALVKHLSLAVYRKLKIHWRKIVVGLMVFVVLFVIVLPNLKEILYFAALFLLGKLGLLDGDDIEGYKYEDDDYYNDNYDYNYQQRQEEEYQREVDLGFH